RISPDRRWIAYVSEESGRPEVSVRNLTGPATRVVISASGGDQPAWARSAPYRRWIAYVSEESGRPEVSVRNLTGPATRVVISASGGDQPVWARSGSELFRS